MVRVRMVISVERVTSARWRRALLAAYVAICCAVAAALTTAIHTQWVPPLHAGLVLSVALFAGCVGVVAAPISIAIGKEAHTFILAELPIVVAVLTMRTGYAAAWLIPAIALFRGIVNRLAITKTIFNSAVFAIELALVSAATHLLAPGARVTETRLWIAVIVGVTTSNLASSALVSGAIRLSGGRLSARETFRNAVTSLIGGVAMASIAVIAVVLTVVNPVSVVFSAAISMALYVAYRRHMLLARQHDAMLRLERFTSGLAPDRSVTVIVDKVLVQVNELLNSEDTSITLASVSGGVFLRRTSSPGTPVVDPSHPLWTRAHSGPGTFVLHASDRSLSAEDATTLASLGARDLIVTPLRLDDDNIGVLIGRNRRNSIIKTSAADLDLITTMANQTSVILERSRLIEKLAHEAADRKFEATHDSLTGLPNRAAFNHVVDAALPAYGSDPATVMAPPAIVMLVDLNQFKKINDTMGHHAGDDVLVQISARLGATLPEDAIIARLGGDEFAVFVPGVNDPETAVDIATSLREAISLPVSVEDVSIALDAAIGISLSPAHGTDRHTLLKCADIAMYAAKERRATPVAVYEASHQRWTSRDVGLVEDLRHAIEGDQLWIAFQPKTSLADGHVVGVEALCRWTHPVHGPIRPDEFIRLAEQAGLIDAITEFVVAESLQQCRVWLNEGLRISVAVNLPASNLSDPALPMRMASHARAANVPTSMLTLEVTEGELMADAKSSRNVMQELRSLGFRVSIDDFGTGYSSLAYLHTLPVDELKIDRAFVRNIGSDATSAQIVHIIVELAKTFGLQTVAEGIETDAIHDALGQLGVELGQGFLMAKPAPAAELSAMLRAGYRTTELALAN